MQARQAISPGTTVAVGMLGLAAAMGIGRFASTPLLPLMQAHSGLSLAQGASLAAANYAGYLAGALWCVFAQPRADTAARTGLAGVAVSTLAMALTADVAWWMVWRASAGVASALTLVGISAWTLQRLALARRAHCAGWVFAGVGVGIVFAGVVSLVIGVLDATPDMGWLVLGAAATVAWVAAAPRLRPLQGATPAEAAPSRVGRFDAEVWRLIVCYGIFGFGYIIPATFLPALAWQLIADPATSRWIWPVFGVAAAMSTVAASLLFRDVVPWRLWAIAQVVMAAGVAAPAAASTVGTLLFAATAIGGTFMLITMAGMQEARRVAGNAGARLIAGMTAAFALGQLLGPVVVGVLSTRPDALRLSSLAAAALSIASVALLTASRRPDDALSRR